MAIVYTGIIKQDHLQSATYNSWGLGDTDSNSKLMLKPGRVTNEGAAWYQNGPDDYPPNDADWNHFEYKWYEEELDFPLTRWSPGFFDQTFLHWGVGNAAPSTEEATEFFNDYYLELAPVGGQGEDSEFLRFTEIRTEYASIEYQGGGWMVLCLDRQAFGSNRVIMGEHDQIEYHIHSTIPEQFDSPGQGGATNEYSSYLETFSHVGDEQSETWGVDGVNIEQTLFNSFDPYSGLDIDLNFFNNTNQSIIDSNQDGRIELGMFSFDDDNIAKDNFPDILAPPLKGLVKSNMVNNGDCQFVEKNLAFDSQDGIPVAIWPQGGWGYLSMWGINGRPWAIDQQYLDSYSEPDNQGFQGYGGYYSYVPLSRLAYVTTDEEGLLINRTKNYWGMINHSPKTEEFLLAGLRNMDDDFDMPTQDDINAKIADVGNVTEIREYRDWDIFASGDDMGLMQLPHIAFWMLSKEAYSNDRCLCFQNFQVWNSQYLLGACKDTYLMTPQDDPNKENFGNVFNWFFQDEAHNGTILNWGFPYGEDIVNEYHQYRTLNQVQKIYDRFNDETIRSYSSLKIKFKMKTTHVLPPNNDDMSEADMAIFLANPLDKNLGYAPQVGVGILGSQFNELPLAGDDGLPIGETSGLNRDEFFQAPGGFNSSRYPNANTFESKKFSRFGGMNRFQNSVMNEWETFDFTFNLANDHQSDGLIYGVPYGGTWDDARNNNPPPEIMLNTWFNSDSGLPAEGVADASNRMGNVHFKFQSQAASAMYIKPPTGFQFPDFGNNFENAYFRDGDAVVIRQGSDIGSRQHYNTVVSRLGSYSGAGNNVGVRTARKPNPPEISGVWGDSIKVEAYLMYVGDLCYNNEVVMNSTVDYGQGPDSDQGLTKMSFIFVAYWNGSDWYYDDGAGYYGVDHNTGTITASNMKYFKPNNTNFILGRLYASEHATGQANDAPGITGIDLYVNNESEYPTDYGVSNLFLFLQSENDFNGRVLIDNIECYESYEFTPEVDVRKKISVGNYGTADLTKYYDKDLQPQQYKDSQAPLEAQFYFYPQYPTDETFNVERTPIYEDFERGRFYIYDIDWGDGTPNEFTGEPKQIDENTALYHTYETSGIFEITGTMLRVKTDRTGEPVGVAHNKKFRLNININPGTDEDFKFFGSDGYDFIPFKNTTPIIGGISKQSNYYKKTKRQIGFLNNDEKISIDFKYRGDKLKTELALLKMENQDLNDLEILPYYLEERSDVAPYLLYSDSENPYNTLIWPSNSTAININTIPSEIVSIYYPSYDESITYDSEQGLWPVSDSNVNQLVNGEEYTFTLADGVDEFYWEALQSLKGADTTGFETIHNGISPIKEELGKGIGDCDLTNIKFYTEPKSIWQMLGFEEDDLEEVASPNNPRYWKNIIPKGYSIFDRQGIELEPEVSIDTSANQGWNGINEKFGYNYYYPVLPKHGTNGRYTDELPRNLSLVRMTSQNRNDYTQMPIKFLLVKTSEYTYDMVYESIHDSFHSANVSPTSFFDYEGSWGQTYGPETGLSPAPDGKIIFSAKEDNIGDYTNNLQFDMQREMPFPQNQITNIKPTFAIYPSMIESNRTSITPAGYFNEEDNWETLPFEPYNISALAGFLIDSDWPNFGSNPYQPPGGADFHGLTGYSSQILRPEDYWATINTHEGEGIIPPYDFLGQHLYYPEYNYGFGHYPNYDNGSNNFHQTQPKVFHRIFTLDFRNSFLGSSVPLFYHNITGLGQLPGYETNAQGESNLEIPVIATEEGIENFVTLMGYNLGVDVNIDMQRTMEATTPLEIIDEGTVNATYAPFSAWASGYAGSGEFQVSIGVPVPESGPVSHAIIINKIYLTPVDYSNFTEDNIINNIEYVIQGIPADGSPGVDDNMKRYFAETDINEGWYDGRGNLGFKPVQVMKTDMFTPNSDVPNYPDGWWNMNLAAYHPGGAQSDEIGTAEMYSHSAFGDFLGVIPVSLTEEIDNGVYRIDYDELGLYYEENNDSDTPFDDLYEPSGWEEEEPEDEEVEDEEEGEDGDLFVPDDSDDDYDPLEDDNDEGEDIDLQKPYPDTLPIFFEGSEEGLVVNIINEKIEVDIFNDISGNKNYGFAIKDFSPKYDEKTLALKKTKQRNPIKSSKKNGAF